MNRARLIPVAAAAALSVLYLEFAYDLLQSGVLQNATGLQQGIFILQCVKIAALSIFGRFRNTPFVNVVNLLGAEIVVALPSLALAAVYSGSSDVSGIMSEIFLAWIAGAAFASTPYSIYRITRTMILRGPLLVVLPSGIVVSSLLLLLQSGTASAIASGTGLSGISREIILIGGGVVATPVQLQGFQILLPLTVLYVALLLHGLSPEGGATPSRFVAVAGLAVLVTAVAYGGILITSALAFPFAYLVLPSTLIVGGLLWWSTREA